MAFKTLLPFLFLASISSSVLAQTVNINTPPSGSSFSAGSSFSIQITRPPYIQSQTEVGIALGLQHCPSSTFCDTANNILGTTILYKGSFSPVTGVGQTFDVTIPSDFPTGTAQIGLARLALLGVSNAPYTDYQGVQIQVV
ncbi:hypothetical protein DL96DRAFT_887139 [Flagelloscypha sp. PMI_526]|nr:hypothetical protein DL96DRAFT_887139 [Flagelloscypha sp. PMI_526]